MLWVTEADGRCSFLSRGWSQFTGQDQARGLAFGWLDMVHPEDRGGATEAFREANARQEPFVLEHRLRRADGQWLWVVDIGRPRTGPGGEYLGYVGTVTLNPQRRRAADVAAGAEGIWRIDFTPPVDTRLPVDAQIARAFRDGRFAECNEDFARMYGFAAPAEVVGQGLSLMMDEHDPQVRAYLAGLIAAGYRGDDVESLEHDREGRPLWFANSLSGVVERGLLIRAWGTQREITARKKGERGG